MDNNNIAYIFPGQGSQFVGMGKDLFQRYPDFVSKADKVLGYSIEELCTLDPDNKLNNTQYTQPAMYTVNALMYLDKMEKQQNIKPNYLAGHSLGEYNALHVAGAFDFEVGLELVKYRAELMAKADNGVMTAVMGLESEEIEKILQENGITEVDLANLNTKYQTIISGKEIDIDKATILFEQIENVRCVRLNTSGAFHSRQMKAAKEVFEQIIERYEFGNLKIPVISNCTSKPYVHEKISELLVQQICSPVLWFDSMKYIMGHCINAKNIIQVGPGTVLSDMIVKIGYESPDILTNAENKNNLANTTKAYKDIEVNKKISLGNQDFERTLNLKFPYVCGSMYYGIASPEMIIRLAKAGMLGFIGTSICNIESIKRDINIIKNKLDGEVFGLGVTYNQNVNEENSIYNLILSEDIKIIEISDYMSITKNLIKYRVKGMQKSNYSNVMQPHHVMAKVSRIEMAELFLKPAPSDIIEALLEAGEITQNEAECAACVPVADFVSITSENDIHISSVPNFMLLSEIKKLSREIQKEYLFSKCSYIGIAGGIGNPDVIALSFLLGADYVVSGSINQCCKQANISDITKNILATVDIHDCEYVPDLKNMELGIKMNVVRKGLLFPARANKLFDLYKRYNAIDEIEADVIHSIETRIFKKNINTFSKESEKFFSESELKTFNTNPKSKLLHIIKCYYQVALHDAIEGNENNKINFLIKCNPTMGFFNRWAKGKSIENWIDRDVDKIGIMMLEEASTIITKFKEN